jgi:hypothetical protein
MSQNLQRRPALFDGLPFTVAEAAAEGLDRTAIRRLARNGQIRKVVRGVYIDGAVPDSIPVRAAAVAKVIPPDAIICRRTAAWLYGIDAFAFQELAGPPPIETLRPPHHRSIRLAGSAGHAQTVLADDVTTLHGLQITSPLATAVHLARHRPRPFALSALDAMCHAGLVQPPDLLRAVQRYPHHPGIVKARELVELVEPATESPGESWLRLRLVDAGLGSPVPQVEISDGVRTYRVDLAYLHLLRNGRHLALEYDSDLWHDEPDRQRADAVRRGRLAIVGWDVMSVTGADVWGPDPKLERAVGELLGRNPRLPRLW